MIIQVESLTKYYENTKAIRNVTFNVEKGEMIFITGPSGSGKTTLLKLLYLYEKPDEGSIFIAGFDTANIKQSSIPHLRRNIGFVFQDFKLLNKKTVYDNIALTLRIRGVGEMEIRERVYSTLKLVKLRHKIDNFPDTLSGGEQQRITLARAVVGEPTVMLADEPTGNLDIDNEEGIMRIFKDVNTRGTTTIIATHNRDLFKNTGRRVLVLDNGNLVCEEIG